MDYVQHLCTTYWASKILLEVPSNGVQYIFVILIFECAMVSRRDNGTRLVSQISAVLNITIQVHRARAVVSQI
jgi:hypothetical protein